MKDKITFKHVNGLNDEKLTFLQTAAIYNPEAVKCAIDSNYDITYTFKILYHSESTNGYDNKSRYSAVTLMAIYSPDAFKYYLHSKYCNEQTIMFVTTEQKACHHYALECQPLSLYHMINCGNELVDSVLNAPYDNGYRVYDIIKIGNPGVTSLKNAIDTISLFKYYNVKEDDSNDNQCQICCDYRARTCLEPCKHYICIACAIKLRKCPVCREHITDKIVSDKHELDFV